MALNGSHLRELEPSIHSLIKKQLGFSEPTLLKASMNCLQQGGNRDDLEGKADSEHLLEHFSKCYS